EESDALTQVHRAIRPASAQNGMGSIGNVRQRLKLWRILRGDELEGEPRSVQTFVGITEAVGADAGITQEGDRFQPVYPLDRPGRLHEERVAGFDLALPHPDVAKQSL